MKGIFSNSNNKSKVGILSLLIGLFFISPLTIQAQCVSGGAPEIPRLSLTGGESYDEEWFPDGNLYVPQNIAAANNQVTEPKRIYVPVFFQNRNWGEEVDLFADPSIDEFPADPITSFEFSILYHSEVLIPIGWQTTHPKDFVDLELPATDEDCAAVNWNITLNTEDATDYRTYIQEFPNADDRANGRRLRISGINPNQPLPVTGNRFDIMLYVVFEVVPTLGDALTPGQIESIMYLYNDEIVYNDYDVTDEALFKNYIEYLNSVGEDWSLYYNDNCWPNPKNNFWNTDDNQGRVETPGIAGMNNWNAPQSDSYIDPIIPGVVYVEVLSEYPRLSFDIEGRPQPQIEIVQEDEVASRTVVTEFKIIDPITENICNPSDEGAIRSVILENTTPDSRIERLKIKSDADWLQFETSQNSLNFIRNLETEAIIPYVDNGTLLPTIETHEKESPKGQPGDVILDITCIPDGLEPGIYTGHLTFTAENLLNSPVRLTVTFILYDAAVEGLTDGGDNCGGIELLVENSNNPVESNLLIFGTNERGTNGVDQLFGEQAAPSELTGFGARFFPYYLDNNNERADLLDENGDPVIDDAPNGFGDLSPNDLNTRSVSRDIRNNEETNESIIYWVEFDENGDENYPVVVSWDTQDFPEAASLFLRDTENGRLFPSVNMRTANNIGGTRRSFTIQDQRVNNFIIEYTLPDVLEYVDANGDPIIKRGWNFLSLPVRPTNNEWENVYKKASGIPTYYAPSFYAQEERLTAGRGYFVKYLVSGDNVDKTFAGTVISEVSNDLGDQTEVYTKENGEGGWNTVGALSTPTCAAGISFELLEGETELPNIEYTEQYGVYEYVNNEGYRPVSELLPGLGYWIKVDGNGYYKLTKQNCKTAPEAFSNKQDIYNVSDQINLIDNNNAKGSVYFNLDRNVNTEVFELPPAPFAEMFDVRFADNKSLTNATNNVINFQGAEFPIQIDVKNASMNYEFKDALTGRYLGSVKEGESRVIVIDDMASNSIVVENSSIVEGSLLVTPSLATEKDQIRIKYTNDVQGNASIVVYDMLGNVVTEIENVEGSEGPHYADLNNDLLSGKYIVTFKNASGNYSQILTVVK